MQKSMPAVRDILDTLYGEATPGSAVVPDPVTIIGRRYNVTPHTAKKYLRRLAHTKMAALRHTPQGSIHAVVIAPSTLSKLAVPQPHIVETGPTAVLVDVDNVVRGFKKEGLNVSFAKLKEYLRSTLGTIGFCDAYVSPRSQCGLIASLWDAGFDVIACPMGSKDKDAVDEKMRLRALKYLLTTDIQRIAVVSRDSDFRPLVSEAADRNKQVTLLNLTPVLTQLSGTDPVVAVHYSRSMQRFLDALERVRYAEPSFPDPDFQFVTHVASLVKSDFRGRHDDRHLDAISMRIRHRLLQKWRPSFLVQDIDTAMRALQECGALRRNGPSGLSIVHTDGLWQYVP